MIYLERPAAFRKIARHVDIAEELAGEPRRCAACSSAWDCNDSSAALLVGADAQGTNGKQAVAAVTSGADASNKASAGAPRGCAG